MDRKYSKQERSRSRSQSRYNVGSKQGLLQQSQPSRRNRNIYIKDLPKKPLRNTSYNQNKKDIVLTSNIFQVKFANTEKIYIYAIQFNPDIQTDNRVLRRQLIMQCEEQFSKLIGKFVLSGNVIFGNRDPEGVSLGIQANINHNDIDYEIYLKKVKTVDMKELQNPDPRCSSLPIQWFNILVKMFLRQMGFFEYGRTAKFYNVKDLRKKITVTETRLNMLMGFATSFQIYEAGLCLKIDMSHRLIRQENVLSIVKQIYKDNTNLSKDEKRNLVREEIIGTQVIANYSNFRIYVVTDLLFDKDVSQIEQKLNNGEIITLDKYYQHKYNITIQDKKAPILVAKLKDDRIVYLISELCIMSGMPKNFTEFQRKKVSQHCISDPQKRLEYIVTLARHMNSLDKGEVTSQQIQKAFGIEINPEPFKVNAKQLAPPRIIFGQNKNANDLYNGQFQSTKYPAYKVVKDVSYAIIHPYDFNINEFERHIQEMTKGMGVKFDKEIKLFKLGENRSQQLREIEQLIKNKISQKYSIVIIVLDNSTKKFYNQIKQLCVLTEGLVSQVVMSDTLKKKGMPIICGKLVCQILSKIGNTIWIVEHPPNFPKDIMVICALVSSCALNGKQIISFCASMNTHNSQFYSEIVMEDTKSSSKVIQRISMLVHNALKSYRSANGSYPQSLIYFREGLDDQGIQEVLDGEIGSINSMVRDVCQIENKMTVITVMKSMSLRYFWKRDNNYSNPPSGTVVDQQIVSNYYEFYMISQHATRGCVSPTQYRVVYDSIGLPMEILQDFIFAQCFNYMNWSGAIRVPAIIQYATKLSKFISDSIGTEPLSQLSLLLYYL